MTNLSVRMRAWLGLMLLGIVGCGSTTFYAATPPGFVEMPDQEPGYQYRAVSADGVVVGVRSIEHEPKGDKEFWVQAIRNRMRDRGGYALLSNQPVKTKSGLEGTQLKFGHDEKGQSMLYTITLFVTPDYLFLVEFGGTEEEMTRQAAYLNWIIENFRRT